jgi:uncharacterized membrane protein YcfT
MNPAVSQAPRVDWVDYAKGICIVMVVMMHSTLGVEKAAGDSGWLHHFVEFARPFRMPDFFLISGLFLSRVIGREWRTFFDRRIVHFVYFYVLWVTIQFVFRAPGIAHDAGIAGVVREYLFAFIEPFGTLWFIYLLPIFALTTRLTRFLPPAAVFIVAAVLESLKIETGWTVIDEFASRYVYFFAGYWLASYVFVLAAKAQAHPKFALLGLAAWAFVNGMLVHAGFATLPGISLLLGAAGALAIVSIAALLERFQFLNPLRFAGEHSIAVYLAFFLPMAATRTLLLKFGFIHDLGTVSLIVTAMGVVLPLALYVLVQGTRFAFLFERPRAFRVETPRRPVLQPAE